MSTSVDTWKPTSLQTSRFNNPLCTGAERSEAPVQRGYYQTKNTDTMRQYPIWCEINSCSYKTPKSYGVKNHSDQHIKVGTSRSNSHDFATVTVTHRQHEDGSRTYRLMVDGVIIKEARLVGSDLEMLNSLCTGAEQSEAPVH